MKHGLPEYQLLIKSTTISNKQRGFSSLFQDIIDFDKLIITQNANNVSFYL